MLNVRKTSLSSLSDFLVYIRYDYEIGRRLIEQLEQGFFHEFAFNKKGLKHSTNFESVQNVHNSNVVEFEFELRHISRSNGSLSSIRG